MTGDAFWGFIGVVIGSLVTGSIALLGQWLIIRGEAKLDGYKRQDNRRLDRDRFQRETLLAFQDAVNDLSRASAQVFVHDSDEFRATGKWRSTLVPADIDGAEREARTRVFTLRSRVADGRSRELAQRLLDKTWVVATTKIEADAALANSEIATISESLAARSGDLILATYAPPAGKGKPQHWWERLRTRGPDG